MNIYKTLKNLGYSLSQAKANIELLNQQACDLITQLEEQYKPGTGMYYPVENKIVLPPCKDHEELYPHFLSILKSKGIEFIENGTCFRV